jgi:TolB-like protein
MPPEPSAEVKFEIGHVLFIDIVSYSKMLITEQSELLQTLKGIVRGTEQFRLAKAEGKLLGLPTGDGGALVFRTSPEAPVLCAIEISRELKRHPELRVRMGIHSGPVNEISDLNEQANIAGAGINIAQRVMDCGDAGHILLSQHVADDLEQYPRWRAHLHDLGECEVKHGVRVRTVNFFTDEVGNPEVPEKFKHARKGVASLVTAKKGRGWIVAIAAILVAALLVGGVLQMVKRDHRPRQTEAQPKESGRSLAAAASVPVPEKSIAVLPFENLSEDKANAYFADGIQDEILTRLAKIADLKVISRTSTQHYKSAPENLSEIGRQLGVAHILEGSVQKSGDAVRVNVQLIKAANDSHVWADIYDRKLTDIFSVESDIAKAITSRLRAHLTGQEEQVIAAKPTDNPEAYDAYLRGLAYTLKTLNTPANALGAQKYLREAVRLDPKFALAWALLSYTEARGYITLNLQPTVALREEARQAAETALALQPNLGEAVLAKGYYHYSCLKDYDTAAQEVAGDHIAAQESWRQARTELEPFLKQQPENYQLIADLALTNMGLGDKAAAFKLIEPDMAMLPIEKDALDGPVPLEVLARVAAQMGEPDRAIASIQKLLSIPYEGLFAVGMPLTPALLRLDPMFDPLRNDPRFQKLCEEK